MARLGSSGCCCWGRGFFEDAWKYLTLNLLLVLPTLQFLAGTNFFVQTSALKLVAPAMSPSQSYMPVHSMAPRAKNVKSISVQPVHQQRTKNLHSSTVAESSTNPPISARSSSSISSASDLSFNLSDQSHPLVEHSRRLATTSAPPNSSLNSSTSDSGLVQPPESPHNGCCTANMIQKRGNRGCHCVYPVKIELFLSNVSLDSNWSNEFLDELASQLNLRVAQFEVVYFDFIGASSLHITMDIAPHTGISFSADQVTAINYSLSSHTVRIDPVLIGEYYLVDLTWFRPFATVPAPAFTISPKVSPSTSSSSLRPWAVRKSDKRPSLITFIIICAGALIVSVLIILAICFCILRKRKKKVPPVETLSGSLRAFFFVVLRLFWKKSFTLQRNNRETKENIELILSRYGIRPKRYKYNELKMITRSFSEKLGGGGYGMVFKGVLRDGRVVAVKLLHNSSGDDDDFVNEVVSIVNTSHINIVCLLGFCLEGSRRGLVYEYMTNGSLERYIYSENPKSALGWEQLYEISIGIARGLEYLHKGCNRRIIHFDIKPQNILLDENYSPKIADFGLAKLCNPKESIVSMAGARGTIGFIAPEVFSRSFGVVSTKSDIYSFGMMLLEMVGGRRNVQTNAENSSQVYLPQWLHDHLSNGGRLENFEVTSITEEIARKMAMIGLWCIQIMPEARPSITKVIEMLERSVDEIEIPPMQFFSCPSEPSIHSINTSSVEDV